VASGCALRQPPAPVAITDLKQVVGTWEGWVTAREGTERFRVQLSITPDGQYTWVVLRGSRNSASMQMVDGVLRSGTWDGKTWRWYGVLTLVEERGTQYLTWARPDGTVIAEFDRSR
jgi:hypothetical protein